MDEKNVMLFCTSRNSALFYVSLLTRKPVELYQILYFFLSNETFNFILCLKEAQY